MKFLENSNYYEEVEKCFRNDEPLDAAVAFWGIDSLPLFDKNKKIRMICNLESGACNPHAIEAIGKHKNVTIKTNPSLHAKVLIQKSTIIIGSANISINGLAMEGRETEGWIESGLKTKNKKVIKKSSSWFTKLWGNSSIVSIAEIEKYKATWVTRRRNRPIEQKNSSLLEAAKINHAAFQDRKIYFVICRDNRLSDDATKVFLEMEKEYKITASELVCYEDFQELPDSSYLIDLYFGPRKGKKVHGLYETPSEPLTGSFIYEEDNTEGNIKLCFTRKKAYGYVLTPQDKVEIREKISDLWTYGCISEDQDSCIIPFVDGVKIIESNL